MITVLCGGVGAARMLGGLVQVVDPADVTAIVNTADDLELHGLHVSPDIDTIVYTLAGAVDPDTGWGLAGESWNAMDALDRYGVATWFRLGDLDLATHLFRTGRLRDGATLSSVTTELASAWGLALRVLPMSDDPVRTIVSVPGEGDLDFQEYFVQRRHDVTVRAVRFEGAETARPAPGVLGAVAEADVVVVAPSNPIVSVGPILSVPGIDDAIRRRREDVVAVSPIIAGRALKGPADRLLSDLGHEPSVVGVARLYRDRVGTLVIDEADAGLAGAIAAEGVRPVVAPAVMSGPEDARTLAASALGAVGSGRA